MQTIKEVKPKWLENYNTDVNFNTLDIIREQEEIKDNWILWGLGEQQGLDKTGQPKKPIKPPINSKDFKLAKSNDKNTWNSFEFTKDIYSQKVNTKFLYYDQTEKQLKTGFISGIGLMLPNTDLMFVDIDKCINEDGRLSELAIEIINTLNSYTEISPSGTGIKILLKDDGTFDGFRKSLSKTHNNNKNVKLDIEIYTSIDNRYTTLTGNVYAERYVINNNMAVKELYRKYWKKDKPDNPVREVNNNSVNCGNKLKPSPKLRSEQVLTKLRNQKTKQDFIDIYDNGKDIKDNFSSTDIHLMNMIVFYTQNQEQAINIYRESKHHENRDSEPDKALYETQRGYDYINRTFERAIKGLTNTYQPRKQGENNEFYYENDEGKQVLDHTKLRDHLKEEHHIFNTELGFYVYDGKGLYDNSHRNIIAKLIESHVEKKDHRESCINEVINRLAREWKYINTLEPQINIINLDNCFLEVDMANGNITKKEHDPKYIFTKRFDLEYNSIVRCEVWQKFLNDVLPEDQQKLLQEILGYMLIGDNTAKRLYALLGKGDCGKSVILNTLNNTIGKKYVSNVAWQKLADPNSRFVAYSVYNKLVNITGDLPQKALGDTGLLKELTGNDVIEAEVKNANSRLNFNNTCRLLASMNKLPPSPSDKTDAWYNRLLIIPFEIVIPKEKQDKNLIKKFNLTGVFNWMVEGLQRLIKNNLIFSETQANRDIVNQYKLDNDSALKFISECCIKMNNISAKDLYNAYCEYCNVTGMSAYKKANFESSILQDNTIKKDKHTGSNKNQRGFKNLSLDPESEFYEDIKNDFTIFRTNQAI